VLSTGVFATALRAASEEAAKEEFNPLLPHTAEIIVGGVAFLLLFLLLRKTVFPMFEKAYVARTEAIEGGIAKAEQAQAEAADALRQYQAQLAEARTEAARIRDDARAEGKAIVDQLTVEARESAARITAQSEAALAAQRQQVVTALRSEIGTLAVQLAERVVGESLNDDERSRRVVDRFLADLDADRDSTGTAS
jgi:F-type H+-transporting ATPase subunit b